jgi:hypothetical protein
MEIRHVSPIETSPPQEEPSHFFNVFLMVLIIRSG